MIPITQATTCRLVWINANNAVTLPQSPTLRYQVRDLYVFTTGTLYTKTNCQT